MSSPPRRPNERDPEETRANHITQDTRPQSSQMRQPVYPIQGQAHATPSTGRAQPVPPPGYRPRPARKRRAQAQSGFYLPWWSILIMLGMVALTALGVVLLVTGLGNSISTNQPAPIIRIVTSDPRSLQNSAPAAPSAAPAIEILNQPQQSGPMVMEGPTLEAVIFTPTPIAITLGATVAVEGVGQQELNVRDTAGVIGTTVVFRAPEGTIFRVVDGPAQNEGFTWWRIQDPANPSRSGWAVSNYLRALPEGQ